MEDLVWLKIVSSIAVTITVIGITFKFKIKKNGSHKNIDKSKILVEDGGTYNKQIGDNNTMNIGAQIYYGEEEPDAKEGDTWIN